MWKTLLAGIATLMIAGTVPVMAHHSAAAYFELDKEITVKGTVEKFVFRAPHAVLRFTVTNENGEEELWRAQTLPSNLLYHRGWRHDMFDEGETVTITGNPSKDPEVNALEVRKIVRENGDVVTPDDGGAG
jgi:DNA/RNA endonuclease YhcR with UshA esterase domain